MKVYSINPTISTYQYKNQKLQDKQCPKPNFGLSVQNCKKTGKPFLPVVIAGLLALGGAMSSCFKITNQQSQNGEQNVYFNYPGCNNDSTNHTTNTDTITIDTIAADTLKYKPIDGTDTEFYGLGIDTADFTSHFSRALNSENVKYTYDVDWNKSRPGITAYNYVITSTLNGDTIATGECDRQNVPYTDENGNKKYYTEEHRTYKYLNPLYVNNNSDLIKPKYVQIVNRGSIGEGNGISYFDGNHNHIESRFEEPLGGDKYLEHMEGNNGPWNQNVYRSSNTINWGDVPYINDNGKN